ncbi:MAG TPA: LuxR C-terminal-related transcriptional regulator [Gaiellaceae bacterium]|nr:LuxR C-terminal-related transcriptional regulator [Gaiellaceae bacterium]
MEFEAGKSASAGRNHIIERPRLTRLLDESNARIILLIAPAGYGKTTLAREWLASRRHGWYRGSSATADVAALALGLAKAAATIVPGAGDRLASRLRVSRSPTDEAAELAELLAADLTEWPDDAWLAFDDYQFACDSGPAELFVEHLLSACAARILVASRSRPLWATARRMVYGEYMEVGRNLLAMNAEEAECVLADRNIQQLEPLVSQADGWPALLGLARDTSDPMPGGSVPDEIYNFFAEELYQAASPELRRGLRRLALAPYVTHDVAEAALGAEADRLIDSATALGFFVSGRDRLELHPLLRMFLSSKFRIHRDDETGELVPALAELFMAKRQWDCAFELASWSDSDEVLLRLLEMSLTQLLEEGRLPTLGHWVTEAKGRALDHPLVDIADAELALRRGEVVRAEALACQAARRFDMSSRLLSRSHCLAGMSAHLDSRDEAALSHFTEALSSARSDEDVRRALLGQFLATDTLARQDEALTILSDFVERSENTIDDLLRIRIGKGRIAMLCGGVSHEADNHQATLAIADRSQDPLIKSSFLNSLTTLLNINGRYAESVEIVTDAIVYTQDMSIFFALSYLYLNQALANLGLRRFQAVRISLSHCERPTTTRALLTCNLGIIKARLDMANNRPERSIAILDSLDLIATHDTPTRGEVLAWSSLAHAVAEDMTVAGSLLRQAATFSRRVEVAGLVPWTKAVIALQGARGVRHTQDAFANAVATGNFDAFVTAYRACPRLLELLAADDTYHDQLRLILERANDHALAARVGIDLPVPNQHGLSGLTKREREVLELVSQGLMNKEIARTLYITEGTAKAHVRAVCKKLGVRTRTEAAMRAAEVGA